MESSSVIVYFDGVCGLCNRFVDFLLKHDKSKNLKFAQLQNTNTVILLIDDKKYFKSDAAIKAIAKLGGGWSVTVLLLVIPKFFRDSIYDWIAKNRYKFFGRKATCRVPTNEEKDRFL